MHRRIIGAVRRLFGERFHLKLLAAFVGVAAFTGVGGVYGLVTQGRLTREVAATYNKSLLPLQNLEEARARTMIGRIDNLQAIETSDPTVRSQASMRIRTADLAIDDILNTVQQADLTDAERTTLARLHADLTSYRRAVNDLLNSRPGDKNSSQLANAAENTFSAVDADFRDLANEAVAAGTTNYAHAKKVTKSAKNTTLALLALAFLVALAVSVELARRLARPVTAVSTVLRAVAAGDLTPRLRVHGRDEMAEMAHSLNEALGHISDAVRDIDDTVDVLATSSEELSAVSQQLAGTAEETSAQAAAVSSSVTQVDAHVQSVASGAEQMGASIREIARNANDAAGVADSAATMANDALVTVERLGEASRQIETVIKVISGIAQQTNLLALNATIEAARAGEAGRGFAVVAHEVKELAQETARATDSIKPLVSALQAESAAVTEVFDGIQRIVSSILEAQNTIASAVEEQTATTNAIAQSIAEAATGSGEIARNISGVASAAQSTSGGAGDTRHAAHQLAELASRLRVQVDRFRFAADPTDAEAGRAVPEPTAPAEEETAGLA